MDAISSCLVEVSHVAALEVCTCLAQVQAKGLVEQGRKVIADSDVLQLQVIALEVGAEAAIGNIAGCTWPAIGRIVGCPIVHIYHPSVATRNQVVAISVVTKDMSETAAGRGRKVKVAILNLEAKRGDDLRIALANELLVVGSDAFACTRHILYLHVTRDAVVFLGLLLFAYLPDAQHFVVIYL